MIYIMIVVMGLAVFLNRYLFIEPRLPVRLNRGAREFLGFAVPGMLTAICGPIIFWLTTSTLTSARPTRTCWPESAPWP